MGRISRDSKPRILSKSRKIYKNVIITLTYLVDLKDSNEAVDDPREHRLERADAQLVQMVTNLRLVHLQEFFEELAETHDGLGVGADGVEVAPIFAVEGSEHEVAVFLVVGQETKRSSPVGELFHWNHTARWEAADYLVAT